MKLVIRILAVFALIAALVTFLFAFSAYAGHGSDIVYSLEQFLSDVFPKPRISMIFYTIGLIFLSSLIFFGLCILFWTYSFEE